MRPPSIRTGPCREKDWLRPLSFPPCERSCTLSDPRIPRIDCVWYGGPSRLSDFREALIPGLQASSFTFDRRWEGCHSDPPTALSFSHDGSWRVTSHNLIQLQGPASYGLIFQLQLSSHHVHAAPRQASWWAQEESVQSNIGPPRGRARDPLPANPRWVRKGCSTRRPSIYRVLQLG